MNVLVILHGRCLDEIGERDCTVKFNGLDGITITVAEGPAPGPGSRLVCRVPELGLLSGHVAAAADRCVRLNLQAGEDRRRRLASRLEWLRTSAGVGERRAAARVVPRIREVAVEWGGTRGAGHVRDISSSGAAIDLSERPPLGSSVTVGARRAIVARHTDDGIGVRFVLPLHPADVHEDAVL